MNDPVNEAIRLLLSQRLDRLEQILAGDVLSFYGQILDGFVSTFREIVEQLVAGNEESGGCSTKPLFIMLTTPGGSPFAAERFVTIIRRHYKEVNFIIPDYAYSAGTVFCMSGDNILMDYCSVLGPIDPQVITKDGRTVPALGYLDKINELITKSERNELTAAEFIILKEFDLAELRFYEQTTELTIDQLKKWLVQYKFKDWKHHKSGKEVTEEEKVSRAEEIAKTLNDTNLWKSHARPINMETLENVVRLKIEDYGKDHKKQRAIQEYHQLVVDYMSQNTFPIFIHTRYFP